MTVNLNQLKCFRTLAQCEHYTRAAEELNMTQSSLSRMIAGLEDELGVYLFEKQGRNVHLTKQGRMFYDHVRLGLGQIEQGVQAVRHSLEPGGGIVDFGFIYALSTNFMPQRIREFSQQTGSRISFRFYQGNSRYILPKIQDESYDLGICSWMGSYPQVLFTPLVRHEYVLVVDKNHPLASRERVTMQDAVEFDFILPLDETSYVEDLFRERGLTPRVTSRGEEDHAVAALVSIGLGCAILPRNTALEQHGVKQISLYPQPLYRDFYLVRKKNKKLSPAAQRFYDFLLNCEKGAKKGEIFP